MLGEALMDVVLESHKAVGRSRAICPVCHTRCGSAHVPGSSNGATQGAASSRMPTPSEDAKGQDVNSPAGTGTSTPSNGKTNGNILFECVNCKRQVASNRYAAHLGDCMGLNTRRGATRNASSKSKLASEAGRSASPLVASESGHISDGGKAPTAGKGKGKSKAKRTDEAEFNLHRKRPGSPSVSPAKKQKRAKPTGSPVARVKADPDLPGSPGSQTVPLPGSHSRVPSKLRDSSVVSSIPREQRSSSPEMPSRRSSPARSISTLASAPSLQSPTPSARPLQKSKGKNGKAAPPKRPSPPPPRPPPAPVMPISVGTDYLDDEGEETGSSTDTDSS
ncbi:hypothetical protein WOLCODRAFT_22004 [Wolfiporia cocos MD-104 SS10]|uniref:SAGA-associated factor 11 n=1 Tax=Wolfiporia cocos (strain MD-104) TaxID=742152 RepID=A0A2H3ITX9_WOLCO|nr:hypothetical protein WOLCODRAFT_22004 [Wolfiporia cocos MD-104 SS10]